MSNKTITIDENQNCIIPESLKRIPQYNHRVQTYTIDCPRYTQNGEDMLNMIPFVSVEKEGTKEPITEACTLPKKKEDDENRIVFDWTITRDATDTKGKLAFVVCIKKTVDESIENAWHTHRNEEIKVEKGIACLDILMKSYPAIIDGILVRLGLLEKNGVSGSVSAAAVSYDDSKTELGADNVQDAFGKVLETIGDLKASEVTGISAELTGAFVNYFKHVMPNFDDANGMSYVNAILTALGAETREESGSGGEEPEVPTEKTLSSISASYSGGEVAVGTALTDLTGIVVTAHYSDGTTASVTDYTLSGSIVEGSNTITVSYGGKTTTFTVTGVAESGGGDDTTEVMNLFDKNTMVRESTVFNNATYAMLSTHGSRDLITIPIELSEDTWFCISNKSKPASGWSGYNPPDMMVASVELTTVDTHNAFVRKYYLANSGLKYGDDRTGKQVTDENVITKDTTGVGVAFLVPANAKYIYINESHNDPEYWETLMVEKGKTCHDYVDYVGV